MKLLDRIYQLICWHQARTIKIEGTRLSVVCMDCGHESPGVDLAAPAGGRVVHD